MSKKRIIKWILISLLIIIAIALLSWWLAENNFPSAIGKESWLSFFGSYFGSTVGAGATIVGVYLTFQYQKENDDKNNKIKEKQYLEQLQDANNKDVLPFFVIKKMEHCSLDNFDGMLYCNPVIFLNPGQTGEQFEERVYFKNIGKGPVLNLEIRVVQSNKTWSLKEIDVIEVGDSFLCDFIYIADIPDEIKKDEILDVCKNELYEVKIAFKNIYGKQYLYTLMLEASVNIDVINEKFQCDVSLKEWKMNSEVLS